MLVAIKRSYLNYKTYPRETVSSGGNMANGIKKKHWKGVVLLLFTIERII